MEPSLKDYLGKKNFEKNNGEKDGSNNVNMQTDGDGGNQAGKLCAGDGDGRDKNQGDNDDSNGEDGRLDKNGSCADADGSYDHEKGNCVGEDGMTVDNGHQMDVDERNCLSRFFFRLKSFESKLANVQMRLKDLEAKEEDKRKMASQKLEEYVESAVSGAGKFGCSRDYVRKVLRDAHGMSFDSGYARTKLNRTLRKFCDDGIFKQCGNLFIWSGGQ